MSDVEQVPEQEIDIDGTRKIKKVKNKNKYPSSGRCFSNFIVKIAFSTPGLVVLVASYSIMGAFVFPILEAPREARSSAAIARSREECLKELWTITEKLNVLYEKNWTMLVHEQLRRFEGSIVAATRNGIDVSGQRPSRWSFSEALLYSITVITTIGHGNLTPKTSGGKIVTIIYALIGVPLMLMCLSSLGGLLADALQCTYIRICCSRRRRRHHSEDDNGQSQIEMDCNVCKYDAVCNETKLHGYEYTTVTDREDACHLIRDSPIKSNHGSPCSTLKSSSSMRYITSSEKSSPVKQMHQIQQHPQQHYQFMNQIHQNSINCGSDTTALGLAMGTSTTYFPLSSSSTSNNLTFTCNSTAHFDHPGMSNVKYHGMQLQTQLSHNKSTESAVHHVPHTATVHSIRRGKFIPKPMPQEINMLLAESDIPYRHDIPSTNEQGTTMGASVDIMEEEEETQHTRIGCPHGTPSRVPLISSLSAKMNICQGDNDNGLTEDEDEGVSAEINTPQVPIAIVLLILVSYIGLGTVIFSLWENWSIIDGAYFCFVTLSTIGYGDFLPQQTFRGPDVQLFACCAYLLLGLVLVAMSFSLLETRLLWKCKRIAVRLKLAKD